MIALLLSLTWSLCWAASTPQSKMRNGPPADFATHRVPAVSSQMIQEHSAFLEAFATQTGNTLSWTHDLDCDSDQVFAFSVYSNHLSALTLQLSAPDGTDVDLSKVYHKDTFPISDDGAIGFDAHNFVLNNPQVGVYKVSISAAATTELVQLTQVNKKPLAAVLAYNDSPVSIVTHLNTFELEVGKEVGLLCRVTDSVGFRAAEATEAPEALVGAVAAANMVIMFPGGTETEVPMTDDGINDDGVANNGVYGASFVPTVPGQYVWRAQVSGSYSGVAFQRSTQHLIRIARNDATLLGTGSIKTSSARVSVKLNVHTMQNRFQKRVAIQNGRLGGVGAAPAYVHTYAELYTTSGTPVAFAMAATPIVNGAVELTFDSKWLRRASLTGKETFELRNAFISELAGYVPISKADTVSLTVLQASFSSDLSSLLTALPAMPEIDEEMRHGPVPQWIKNQLKLNSPAGATPLILVHGYCSSDNPFVGVNKWTNAYEFQDFKANIGHDEFAKRIWDFAQAKKLKEFVGIGHSQGGIALVTLGSTYWSGLDVSRLRTGQRAIQSVGTPYKGCSGAGTGASLIQLFGIACGANADLTPDGAALWLPTVSEVIADNTFYYTTIGSQERNPFVDTPCSYATALVLDSPSDGTTELSRSDLPGGHNLGTTLGQCHTIDMNFGVQTADWSRNREMNGAAQGQ